MKFEDFRIGWRLLLRQPAYSVIAVLGLSLSFAACFLILTLVRYSFSFDTSIPDVANVYVVQSRAGFDDTGWTANSPMLAAEALENGALALTSARVLSLDGIQMRIGDTTQAIATLSVDPTFGSVLGISPLQGDLTAALGRPDGLVLTQRSATRLFGDTEALGKTVLISGKQFQVGAIIPDPVDNTTLQYAALTGINSAAWVAKDRDAIIDNWSDLSARMYVRLGAGVQPESVARLMADAVEKSSIRSRLSAEETAELGSKPALEMRLRPLTESYLSGLRGRGGIPTKRSKIEFIILFSVSAALVLLLATINYINLTTVRTISRQREIAMRKVLGASRMSIVSQMVAESMLVVLVSATCGLLLALLLMPGFSHLLQLRLDSLLNAANVGAALLIGLAMTVLVGTLAGTYPAWIALKVRPALALGGHGSSEGAHGMWLRRLLTVFQFAIALGFSAIALSTSMQMRFLSSMDLGFNPDPMLSLIMPVDMTQPAAQSFVDEVRRVPGVAGVVTSEESIGEGVIYQYEVKTSSAKTVLMRGTRVSPGYFDFFGVKPISGRLFDSNIDQLDNSDVIVIDANAVIEFGFASPEAAIGQFLTIKDKAYRIVGVNGELITQPITSTQYATLYLVSPKAHTLTVKVGSDPEEVQAAIAKKWRAHFPESVFEMDAVRTLLERSVKEQMAPYIAVLNIATLITAALAAFGMYILSATSVQRKTREIVIRKLYGARRGHIASLLVKEFAVLLGVAAVIGMPLGVLGGLSILSEFAVQAPWGAWAVVPALAGAILVAALSSLQHTLAAMRIAPAVALRS
jgi:putative ABC transport system permease protein